MCSEVNSNLTGSITSKVVKVLYPKSTQMVHHILYICTVCVTYSLFFEVVIHNSIMRIPTWAYRCQSNQTMLYTASDQ